MSARTEVGTVRATRDAGWGQFALPVTAGVIALIVSVGGALWTLGQPPLRGREGADLLTMVVAAMGYLIAGAAAVATAAGLLRVALLTADPEPAGTGQEPSDDALEQLWLRTHRAAVIWRNTAIVLIPLNAAASSGLSIGYVLRDPLAFLSSVQTAQAWLLVAIGATVLGIVTGKPRTWSVSIVSTVLAIALTLPTVVTAQVSVGANHDLATDSAIILTLAGTAWFAAAWAGADLGPRMDAAVRRRIAALAVVGAILVIPARVGVGIFEMAGTSPWGNAYGWSLVVLIVLYLLVTVLTVRPSAGSLALARAGIILIAGVQAAQLQLVPPRFVAPQTINQNFLGFEVPDPPTLATVLLPGRPNLLLTVVAIAAMALYSFAVYRLRRDGHSWPTLRLVSWLTGWVIVLLVSMTGVWAYSSVTFSWHMGAHMTLNMLAPPFLVLAGPITLALRVLPATGGSLPPLRNAVVALTRAGWLQRLLNPLLVWVVFVAGFYVLYFSLLFASAMRFHWAHQFMTFHFLIIGCLFFGLAIGVDRPAHDIPAVARLAVVFAAMPFHAFFAIAVISSSGTIGGAFYGLLNIPWMTDLVHDEQVGGQIAWATGELPMLIVLMALLAQWFSEDQRTARRLDRAARRDGDSELAAYNALLAELAERDKRHEEASRD
ncbi:MAG: cytochrome c oxidase assembly protein [Micropruina sp.]|uniref:cytochrome c oxidase assembly protein n=1 Tax=Micropruina sp. TaxID=2737536 RepID=UPI0039E39CED